MVRRTVTLPDQLDERVREAKRKGESFSAAVARLLEDGLEGRRVPSYVGIGEGPGDTIAGRKKEVIAEIIEEIIAHETPQRREP